MSIYTYTHMYLYIYIYIFTCVFLRIHIFFPLSRSPFPVMGCVSVSLWWCCCCAFLSPVLQCLVIFRVLRVEGHWLWGPRFGFYFVLLLSEYLCTCVHARARVCVCVCVGVCV